MKQIKFHPFAEVFDLLEGKAFDDLVEDIKTFGLREKIWIYEDKILDGRNRFMACRQAQVEPAYRQFKGTPEGALALVTSNDKRRHSTPTQRAISAAKLATLRQGMQSNASRDAFTQAEAADQMGVSRSSVQRARKVVDKGSKALLKAVKTGSVGLQHAAAVVDLPKSEQLAAATKKPDPEPNDADSDDEDAALEAAEKEYHASIDKVMQADDKLAAAHIEIKRQAAEIAALKLARDGFMNGKAEMTRLCKKEQDKNARLIRENIDLVRQIDALKKAA